MTRVVMECCLVCQLQPSRSSWRHKSAGGMVTHCHRHKDTKWTLVFSKMTNAL
ncbi:hypothetical protein PFLUV_G00139840 [Perca fluviatilis]|uniref:Uncharacterized protein n=1 Tax=Perca fluviatilis TaxID=8168 RepID=A0A6A5E5I4_PERFL|nr:hypothetical protein PFLUV_G00139840 [Perca fluviatilis]